MPRKLTEQEKNALWIALNCRTNYIETGNITISAEDFVKLGRRAPNAQINALSEDQMRAILLSKELLRKVITGKVYIED